MMLPDTATRMFSAPPTSSFNQWRDHMSYALESKERSSHRTTVADLALEIVRIALHTIEFLLK